MADKMETGFNPSFEDLDVLLQACDLQPDEPAMRAFGKALRQLWQAEDTAERNGDFSSAVAEKRKKKGSRLRLSDNHFRPNLEDLGPRDMSSFPVNPLGTGWASAASIGIMSAGSASKPDNCFGFVDSLQSCRNQVAISVIRTESLAADTWSTESTRLDQVWTDARPGYWGEECLMGWWDTAANRIFPGLGTMLLLGGLRQDQDKNETRPCLPALMPT